MSDHATDRHLPVIDYSGEPIVEYRHVAKSFGPKVIYTDLNLAIHQGETITVIGASGVGKSVMLKLLIGLLATDSGDILFRGQNLVGLNEEAYIPMRRQVSMLFQSAALFDSVSVGENIAFPLREIGGFTEEEIQQRVEEKLVLVGLTPEAARLEPSELSGGMRKRVGLARAIATEPAVILYDEPTTGLDPINTSRISSLIVRLQQRLGITSVVVTHEMRLAFDVSNRIAMLHEGEILTVDTPENIRLSTHPVVRNFVQGKFPGFEEMEHQETLP